MNLKEAFRFQNALKSMLVNCDEILGTDSNVTKVQSTHLRKKVMSEAEDETVVEQAESEYADRINDVLGFMMYLLDQRAVLAKAVREAKDKMPIDMDSEVGLNDVRRHQVAVLNRMANLRSAEVVLPRMGTGYRFNAEGNQVTYRCDLKKVTTINFDRNLVRKYIAQLNEQADKISTEIDKAMVNAEVDYQAPFDVNDGFDEAFEAYMAGKQ